MTWHKNKNRHKKQSPDLARPRQTKSWGLERSAEKVRKSEADKHVNGLFASKKRKRKKQDQKELQGTKHPVEVK